MIILAGTSDILRVTTDAAGDIEVHVSYVENDSGTITPARTNTAHITTATTVTILASPASGKQRNAKSIYIRNAHASQTVIVTLEHYDGTNAETLMKMTLLASEVMTLDENGRWAHYDTNGGEYAAGAGLAVRADLEAATETGLGVTPALQHYHPGHPKCILKCGVTGNVLTSYNISSVSDTGAGIATANIATDFSSADWCCQVGLERTATSVTVTNLKYINIRNATQAAGSVGMESYDGTATTHVQEDPTSYHMFGLGTLV